MLSKNSLNGVKWEVVLSSASMRGYYQNQICDSIQDHWVEKSLAGL